MKKTLLQTLIILILTCSASSLFAYTYTFQCQNGGGPAWAQLPVNYWINQNGSDNIPFNELTDVMANSFTTWGDPCCSEFSATYQGTTQLTAQNNNGRIVLSWKESNWPTMFGSVNQTIGVTLLQAFNNCTIAQAPIIFNGVGFTFRTNGQATDMQSISTHEIGHLLGLGHSNTQTATMFAAYIGGSGARTLHQDDENGVCSLYTISCNCQSAAECKPGQECSNARCVDIPCGINNPCTSDKECNANTGQCEIPRCANDGDCAAGLVCSGSGTCQSACPACRTCETNADCGNSGTCADIGNGPRCLVICSGGAQCPGDSQCINWQFQGQNGPQNVEICSAPGNPQLPCPDNYSCKASTAPMDECQVDGDCSGNEECISSGGVKVCRNPGDPCANVSCNGDQTCKNGTCVDKGTTNNGNNDPNNQTNNTTGNNSTNGNGENNDVVVVIDQEPSIVFEENGGVDDGCSTTSKGRMPGAFFLLAFFVFVRRKRKNRRKNEA